MSNLNEIVLNAIRQTYQRSSQEEKERILDGVCDKEAWGFNRNYAIRFFNSFPLIEASPIETTKIKIKSVLEDNTFFLRWKRCLGSSVYSFYIDFPETEVDRNCCIDINRSLTQKI